MPDAGLDKTWRIEVLPGAGVRWQLVPGVAVGVFVDRRCVVDGVDVARWVISEKWDSFREDVGVEFWHWIVEATELTPWKESLSPAGMQTRPLEYGGWKFLKAQTFVDSDNEQDLEHFAQPESCQGNGLRKA